MRKNLLLLPALLAAIFLLSTRRSQAQTPMPQPYPSGQYPAEIRLNSDADLQTLYRLDIDIGDLRPVDGTFPAPEAPFEPLIATVYVTPTQVQALASAGLAAVPLPNPSQQNGPRQQADWPTFAQTVTRMQTIAGAYPNLVRLESIGKSVGNHDIWCLEISDNPDVDEDEPEVKFSAAIHGDELVGIEMTLRLAELLTQSYGQDAYLTGLVDNMEIWLCPISNPDGYISGSRYNAHGKDLNRDFPDRFIDPVDDPAGHELETQAFMRFGYNHRFVMGINYHGGAAVVNYPWDAVTSSIYEPPDNPIPAPDDALLHDYSVGYAIRNAYLYNVEFPEGVTRGWEWYQIWGGMQDWAYAYRGEFHVTIELGGDKNPPYNTMTDQWDHNREAMIWWMSRALTGVHGLVTDAETGAPLDAVVQVQGMAAPNSVRTDPGAGDYHRLLAPGVYTLQASAACYQEATAPITITEGLSATVQNFQLVGGRYAVEGLVNEWGSGRPLAATVEVVDSGLLTTTNPVDGSYHYDLCGGETTLRVSAPGYQTEERPITVDQAQVQNFSLHPNPGTPPPSGLYSSTKQASVDSAAPDEVITYTIQVRNTWESATDILSDTLPDGLTFSGYLTASQGTAVYLDGAITWQGLLPTGETATITYAAVLDTCLAGGRALINPAWLTDGLGTTITRSTTVSVENVAPYLPQALTPADGAVQVPANVQLAWQAADPNCDALTYSIALGSSTGPPQIAQGLTTPTYNPGWLLPLTTYNWFVIVNDGAASITGPTWSFTTGESYRLYLPAIQR